MAGRPQSDKDRELTAEELHEIERKYDPELAFRPTGRGIALFISACLVAMSVYHFYASGFGLIRELLHRGIHLSFVLGLVFLLFSWRRGDAPGGPVWLRVSGVPVLDILFALLAVGAAIY